MIYLTRTLHKFIRFHHSQTSRFDFYQIVKNNASLPKCHETWHHARLGPPFTLDILWDQGWFIKKRFIGYWQSIACHRTILIRLSWEFFLFLKIYLTRTLQRFTWLHHSQNSRFDVFPIFTNAASLPRCHKARRDSRWHLLPWIYSGIEAGLLKKDSLDIGGQLHAIEPYW